MTSIEELLAKAKTAEPETVTVSVMVAGELIDLRFTMLPGDKWADICSHHPMRIDSVVDRAFGYNTHEAAKDAAKAVETEQRGEKGIITNRYGCRVVDGVDEFLTTEQWDSLWPMLAGNDFANIADKIWDLNEYEPSQRVAKAKKVSPRSSKRSRA